MESLRSHYDCEGVLLKEELDKHTLDSIGSEGECIPQVDGIFASIESKEHFEEDVESTDSDRSSPCSTIGWDSFEILSLLGKGGYGKVYQVRKLVGRDSNYIYAIKMLRKDAISKNLKDVLHTTTEREVLESNNHPFLVTLLYAFQTSNKLCLVMEYLGGGELFNCLNTLKKLGERNCRFYICEIILALEYLHNKNIIYRDLKPENILMDSDGHIKLTDFGLCKNKIAGSDRAYTFCGTIEYMAPEMIERIGHNKEVDWWSLGILIYDILVGGPPFSDNSKEVLMRKIISAKLNIPSYVRHEARDLIRKLLRKKIPDRLGYGCEDAEAVRKHVFFKNICWRSVLNREYEPPLKPNLKNELDTSYFDEVFTSSKITPTPETGYLSKSADRAFSDFDYVHPTLLEELSIIKEDKPIGHAISKPIPIPK